MDDKLIFVPNQYELKKERLLGPSLDCEVTYKEYLLIPYCANPVNADYQSMNVYVPVAVDGVETDISDAPVLIDNHLGA
ncbi:MAG: hypothetical protein LUH07_11000 [Lachnospiraceae bacterium]|nr:hypothetical protein [Lachnospiraceae bacterium]